jgi:hypothetical protein
MARFSQKSKDHLDTCHPFIVECANIVILKRDFTVIEGARSPEVQDMCFSGGASKLRGSDHRAKHVIGVHRDKSDAIDVAPYYSTKPHLRFPDHTLHGVIDIQNSTGLRKSRAIKMSKEWAEFAILAMLFREAARAVSLESLEYANWRLRWGGDWNENYELSDNVFNDLPHLEIVRP